MIKKEEIDLIMSFTDSRNSTAALTNNCPHVVLHLVENSLLLCLVHQSTSMHDTSHACMLCALPASSVIDGVEKAYTNPLLGFTCPATPFSKINAHSYFTH
jgi:hypothetical protein